MKFVPVDDLPPAGNGHLILMVIFIIFFILVAKFDAFTWFF